jgi:hypothetical protein
MRIIQQFHGSQRERPDRIVRDVSLVSAFVTSSEVTAVIVEPSTHAVVAARLAWPESNLHVALVAGKDDDGIGGNGDER